MDAASCNIPGNSDLYGLGIRIGVYTQLLSTLVTNHFLPDDVSGTYTSNLIFLCALILAIIRSIADGSGFQVVECYVILQLLLVFFLMSTGGILYGLADSFAAYADGIIKRSEKPKATRQNTEEDEGSEEPVEESNKSTNYLSRLGRAHMNVAPLQATSQRVLHLAVALLNGWFWLRGVHQLGHSPPGCNTYFFLFGPVRSSHPIRVFFAILAMIYLTWCGFLAIGRLIPHSRDSFRSLRTFATEKFDPRSLLEREEQSAPAEAEK
jgi:hypothetical protein